MKTKIVYSEKCLGYGTWHIEGPQRVKVASEILKTKGYEFLEPLPASEEDLLAVHDVDYLWNLKKGLVEDPDTPAYDNIYRLCNAFGRRRNFSQPNRRLLTYASTRTPCRKKRRCIRSFHPRILLPKQYSYSSQKTRQKNSDFRHRRTSWKWDSRNLSRRRKSDLSFAASIAKLPRNRPFH